MSLHSFDPDIAARCGVNAAVIYQNIFFWTRKNYANGRHVHDGKVWTYNSVKALNDLFNYLTPAQIRTAIAKLISAELIVEGNYNASAYDRTKWYGVSCEIHLSKIANGFVRDREPIPDDKPVSNADGNPDTSEPASPEPSLNHHEPSVEPLLVSPDKKPKRPKRKPEVELPEGWVPNDKNIQDAQDRGFTQKEIEHEADNFRNYHSSKQSLYRDWDAAWRTWLGNAIKFGRRGGVAGKAAPGGYGQGRSLASIAAQRRLDGSV